MIKIFLLLIYKISFKIFVEICAFFFNLYLHITKYIILKSLIISWVRESKIEYILFEFLGQENYQFYKSIYDFYTYLGDYPSC